jgi:hypothetical protein
VDRYTCFSDVRIYAAIVTAFALAISIGLAATWKPIRIRPGTVRLRQKPLPAGASDRQT